MEVKKIITGKEAGYTILDCQHIIQSQGTIYQYKHAGQQIYETGIYTRGRSYRPIEGLPGHIDIYILTADGLQCLCYNITRHRGYSALRLYQQSDKMATIDSNIWSNYITNGYTTRRGLLADYNDQIEKVEKIGRSHADLLGCESGDSSADHNVRVSMRI